MNVLRSFSKTLFPFGTLTALPDCRHRCQDIRDRSFFEGGKGLPDQFSFCETLRGETGDVDERFFSQDQLGHDFPTAGLCWKPWPLKPLARKNPLKSWNFSQYGMVIRRDLIRPGPAPVNLRLLHNGHPVHGVPGHLHHGLIIHIQVKRRGIVLGPGNQKPAPSLRKYQPR